MGRTKVGVLASGRGTDFQSLVDARKRGDLDVDLAVLVCNVPGAPVLERAKAANVPAVVVDHRPFGKDREGFEPQIVKGLRAKAGRLVAGGQADGGRPPGADRPRRNKLPADGLAHRDGPQNKGPSRNSERPRCGGMLV